MKLEYLDDMADGGKFRHVVSENLIRLYDFDENQTVELVQIIHSFLTNKHELNLSNIEFIEAVNCKLLLRVSTEDLGILKTDKPNVFTCDLTEDSYEEAIGLMKAVTDGYNWLSITSSDKIDFLYSPGGTW